MICTGAHLVPYRDPVTHYLGGECINCGFKDTRTDILRTHFRMRIRILLDTLLEYGNDH